MANSVENFFKGVVESYSSAIGALSPQMQQFITLLLLTIFVVVYGVLIWKFYILISTKNILRINLNKYNSASHPALEKIVAGGLYVVEYLVILPVLIYISFILFTSLLSIISTGLDPKDIVLISAITISAVRATSYIPHYGESVAKEIAKIVPLTLLVIAFTSPNFFKLNEIAVGIGKIPAALSIGGIYIVFIVILELLLRFIDFVTGQLGLRSKDEDEEADEGEELE